MASSPFGKLPSTGSEETTRPLHRATGAAAAHAAALLDHSRVLVQPYMAAVEQGGERSLVFIGGKFTHAFTRPPFLTGAGILDGMTAHSASPDEVDFARGVIRSAPVEPTYARVDLLRTGEDLWLMELELIEPCLGFRLSVEAARQMAEAILVEGLVSDGAGPGTAGLKPQ